MAESEEVRRGEVRVPAISRLRSFSLDISTPAGLRRAPPPTATPAQEGRYVRSTLVLTKTRLFYESQGWRREVILTDLLGVELTTPPNNPLASQLKVHHYPLTSGRKPSRKRAELVAQFSSQPSREENEGLAREWKQAIRLAAQRALHREFTMTDQQESDELKERRALVLVNPAGGKGRALTEWRSKVQPLFDLAEISYSLVVTERQNHGRELIKTFDLSTIDLIVIASGDGLLYEVVNGIMERPDWEAAIKTPVAMIPVGSGNALCASSLHLAGEEFGLLNAVFQVISGGVIPMDVATVETGGGYKAYSCVLLSWGMVADIDIESEKYRSIGDTRFILGGLSCIVKSRSYHGKLSYLPVQQNTADTPTSAANNASSAETSDNISSATENNASSAENQATGEEREARPPPSELAILSQSPHGPKSVHLPPLSRPVPDSWVTLEKEFLTMSALNLPHMAAGMFGDPNHSIGTGLLSVSLLDAQAMGRADMLYTLIHTDTGAHVNQSYCTTVRTLAYRLEPEGGILTVDGEAIPHGVVQSELHPRIARVVCRHRRTQ